MKIVGAITAAFCLSACGQQTDDPNAPANQSSPISTALGSEQSTAPHSPKRQVSADPPEQQSVSRPPPPPPSVESEGYRAIGTEPFWAVTIKGTTATLERPDKAPERFSVAREDDGRALRYMANGFTMTVTEGPCSDGMSDAIWSDRVSVAFGEGTLKGCGGDRDDPPVENY